MRFRRRARLPWRALALDALAVVLAYAASSAPLPRGWIEHGYANGFFAALNRALVPLTNAVPFAAGDLELLVVLVALIWWWLRAVRGAPRGRKRYAVLALLAHTAGIVALGIVVFELLWGLNYRRATVAARVDYSEQRVTAAAVARFSERIVGILNHDVAAAHAERLDREKLRDAYEPVIARLGDDWEVAVTVPKTTILEPYYEAAGIGGQYSPFSFETFLNASFLPFEVPRAQAHEWAHVGGFTDEGDANYIGTLACLRSDDPLIRYSGAYWTYFELPEAQRRRLRLDPRVVADFKASRARFLLHYKPQLFAFQWRFYDRFLRSNGVRGGVASYGFFLKLLVGTRLDAAGLPVVRSGFASEPLLGPGRTESEKGG
ncbi:MAG: DUF3810 family protein [Candidatus Eremiobacteraeota bacterium]|nr:DUF3810 family protein [Candidatus Eremiobacteraeota bacterium]